MRTEAAFLGTEDRNAGGHVILDRAVPGTRSDRTPSNETTLIALELNSPFREVSSHLQYVSMFYIVYSFKLTSMVDLFSTLLACGVLMMCTVLGLTPLALVLL